MNKKVAPKKVDDSFRWIGPLCGVLAFILYALTLSSGAYPGISAKLIVDYSGMAPFMPLLHPLWWCCAQLIKIIPIGSLVFRMNIFCAICGSLNIWLIYEIVSRIKHHRTVEERRASFNLLWTQRASGMFAAAFLATSIPFWIVSTRAYTVTFDTMIVLLLVRQLQKYYDNSATWRIYVISFGVGVGIMEFPTMLLLAAPILIALFFMMFQRDMFAKPRKKRINPFWGWLFKAGVLTVLGALPALLIAWIYKYSPSYEWREFPHFFSLLVYMARGYFREIGGSTNQLGWLLVSLVSFIPCLAVLTRKTGQKHDQIMGSYFFHLVLALIGVALMFNFHISPWAIYSHHMLLVTPYLFMTVWMGYIAGYWLAFFTQRQRAHNQGKVAYQTQIIGKWMILLVVPSLLILAVISNIHICDAKNAKPIQQLSDNIVDNLNGRTWLISNGVMDDMIKIAANRKNVKLTVVNPRLGASKPYLRYLSTKFDNPRLKGLAVLGLSPLIQEWFSEHSEYVSTNVAVLSNPDIWLAAGFEMIPNGTVYLGSKAKPDPSTFMNISENRELWKNYIFGKDARKNWPEIISSWNHMAIQHVSKIANNQGFKWQETGDINNAAIAYEAACEIEPENISALMNITSMSDETGSDNAESWHLKLDEYTRKKGHELNSWNLSYLYGYVYHPMTYVNRGLIWAMSGKPDLGVAEIKRAVALGGQGEHLKVLLAGMYFIQKHGDESKALYLEILETNPESTDAILGLMHLEVRKGNFDIARGYIKRLEEIKFDSRKIQIEEAILESIAGNKDTSKEILKNLLRKNPGNLQAWKILALIAVEQNDKDLQDKCLAQFRKESQQIPRELLMAMAQVALTQRKTSVARKYIKELLIRYPHNEVFLEWNLRIDIFEFNREAAEKTVERLMNINSKNGFANFILGTLYIYREQYSLAEPALRISVKARRDVVRLNTLAYTLLMNKKYDEAMKFVKESFEVDDRHGPAWDTYGMILYQKGDYDEALKAIHRGLDFQPENLEIKFHLAQTYEKTGKLQSAMDILRELSTHASELPLSVYDEIRTTSNRIRKRLNNGG